MRPAPSCRSEKHCLAHAPLAHEPPGQPDGLAFHLLEVFFHFTAVVGHVIPGDSKGVLSRLLQLGELVPADLEQLRQGRLGLDGLLLVV